jgi:predicted metal-dependent phosphoesterase TrpH
MNLVNKNRFERNERIKIMKPMPYANMHLHSTHSDGVYTPAELVRIAKEEGYRALAITDHDTGSAYPELVEACEKEGMECLFGVEFSVTEPFDFHIVGFNFDPEFPEMKAYLEKMALRQTDNTKKCFDDAVAKGNISGISWDEVLQYNAGIPWLCNNHVFRAMKAKGIVEENEYMAWFTKNFLHQRSMFPPCHNFLPLDKMVDLIKRAGGFAVCAHPNKTHLGMIDVLTDAGVEGLEVLHPDLSKEEKDLALKLCLERGLFVSGGSDHSGLCGGYYSSYESEEALHASHLYVEPLTAGVEEKYFRELCAHKIMR